MSFKSENAKIYSINHKNELQVVVLPGRSPEPASKDYYQKAYELWKLVWKEALLELDGSDELYSDHFTRQDYIVSLFHGSNCVALQCFRRSNLGLESHQEDTWFKPWPQQMLHEIGQEYSNGLVLSWVTIHPDYRRSQANEHLKGLEINPRLGETANFFIQDCGADISYGVTRNNRSVDKFVEYIGFGVLQKNAIHHGVDVNLVAATKDGLVTAEKRYPSVATDLWNHRLVFFDTLLQVTNPGLASELYKENRVIGL